MIALQRAVWYCLGHNHTSAQLALQCVSKSTQCPGVAEVMLACGLNYERQTVVDSFREKKSECYNMTCYVRDDMVSTCVHDDRVVCTVLLFTMSLRPLYSGAVHRSAVLL